MNLDKLGAKRNLFLGLTAAAVLFAITSVWAWNTPCQRATRGGMDASVMEWSQCEKAESLFRNFTNAPSDLTDGMASRLAWLKFATIGSILGFLACGGIAVSVWMRVGKGQESDG